MEFMKFDADKCSLCGICVEKCPFGALTIEGAGIVVSESCRMCGLCVRNCPEKAIQFEQKAKAFNKDDWKNFLIYVEQERGEIHPVTYELVGEARKMAGKVGYEVNCVIVGGEGTKEEILEERRVAEMVCYKCRRTLRKKIRWFSSNQKFYFCLAVCPEHGYMKGKIRMKKSEDGSFFAVKTTKLVGEEGAAYVEQKKEETKKKRAERNKAKKSGKAAEAAE